MLGGSNAPLSFETVSLFPEPFFPTLVQAPGPSSASHHPGGGGGSKETAPMLGYKQAARRCNVLVL